MSCEEHEKKMIEHLKTSYSGDTITCPEAQTLAKEWNVDMNEMARILSNLNIKITECMLGCFRGH